MGNSSKNLGFRVLGFRVYRDLGGKSSKILRPLSGSFVAFCFRV